MFFSGFSVNKKSKTGMIIGIVAGVASVFILLAFGLYLKRRRSKRGEEEGNEYIMIYICETCHNNVIL